MMYCVIGCWWTVIVITPSGRFKGAVATQKDRQGHRSALWAPIRNVGPHPQSERPVSKNGLGRNFSAPIRQNLAFD